MKNRCCYIVLLLSPLMLLAACMAYPVVDDWSYITTPHLFADSNGVYLLPRRNQWRPFDGAFGYILGFWPMLFPWLNHVCVVAGHVVNTLLVCHIGRRLRLRTSALYVATFVFYLSPAMIAALLNTDSLNQIYAQLWGLTGCYVYLSLHGRRKYILWGLTILLACLSKENGIMWGLATPMLAWGFRQTDGRRMKRDLFMGMAVMAGYLILRFALARQILDTESDYVNDPLLRHVRGLVMFLSYSFVPLDYVSIVHPPSRNLLLAGVTAVLSLPFLCFVAKNLFRAEHRAVASLSAAMILLVMPHLLTIYTTLHSYAALAPVALLMGFVSQQEKARKGLRWSFAAYLAAMVVSVGHHWQKSVENGNLGREMARNIIRQSSHPARKVMVVIVEDKSPKYSSFCPRPSSAFGWGLSVRHENNYEWPETYDIEDIPARDSRKRLQQIVAESFSGDFDAVWFVNGQETEVIERSGR